MYSGQDQQPPQYTPPAQRVRFEDIGVAFQLLQKQLGAWVGASTLTSLLSALLIGPLYTFVILQAVKNPEATKSPLSCLLTGMLSLVSIILMAGLQHMALKQLRGEVLSATSFTGAYKKLAPLATYALIMGIISALVSALPTVMVFLFLVPQILLTTLLTLTTLLILDQNLEPIEALKESARVMQKDFWLALAFLLVASMAASLGFIACGVGIVFTMPLYPLCIALLYRNFYPERFENQGDH
jgi:uncharacterized membrane protein